MLNDSSTKEIRTISWKSPKGRSCELQLYLRQKLYILEMRDSEDRKIHELLSIHYIDAIVGLINIIIQQKQQKQSSLFANLFNLF